MDDVSFLGSNDGSIVIEVALVVGRAFGCKNDLNTIQRYITTHSSAFSASRGAGIDGLAWMPLDDVSFSGTRLGSVQLGSRSSLGAHLGVKKTYIGYNDIIILIPALFPPLRRWEWMDKFGLV